MKLNGCLFLAEDDELVKKYNPACNEVSNSIKKELNSELIYDKKSSENQNKLYCNKATDYRNKKLTNVDCNYTCLEVILIN